MSTMTMTPQTSGHRCNCGCSDCKGECCELECLVQPRFFCGQLLTDQDLNALLEWVKGKTALTRYRDGWGVACGLDVNCNSGAGKEGFVSVTQGYAIDCCGNDIIVCEEAQIDLSKYCLVDEDPCRDGTPTSAQRTKAQIAVTPGTTGPKLSFGGLELLQSEVQAVDLFIGYAETASDARNALAKRACDSVEACEYTRTHEGYYLYAKKAEHCDHPAERYALDWEEEYKNKLKELLNNIQVISTINDQKQKVERLSQYLTTHALHNFCFIREWLCDLQHLDSLPARWFEQVSFWLVQDWRSYYLRCDCFGCGPDTGVHLARVWLWRRKDERGRSYCKVVYINQHPPFRRPLEKECWPARTGYLNVARFVWQPADDVVAELRSLGFNSISKRPFTYETWNGLRAQFIEDNLFVPRRDTTESAALIVYHHEDICHQSRVVRFGIGTPPVPPVPPVHTDPNPNFSSIREDVNPINGTTTETDAGSTSTPAPNATPAAGSGLEPPSLSATPVASPAAGPTAISNGPLIIEKATPAAAIVIDTDSLPPTHPLLEIQQIQGIKTRRAMRLEAAGIKNLRDLSKSNEEIVEQALSGGPPHRPAIEFIREAQELIRKIRGGN